MQPPPSGDAILRHAARLKSLAAGADRVALALWEGGVLTPEECAAARDLLAPLRADGIVRDTADGGAAFAVRLCRVFDRWFAVDNPALDMPGAFTYFDAEGHDMVRYVMARERGRSPGTLLDTCTGSGLVGISLAPPGARVVLIDIAPRCVELARANAALNRLVAEVVQGSVFAGVRGPFDLVTANTDYNFLTPEAMADRAARGAGNVDPDSFGLAILREALSALPGILAPDGRAYFYTQTFETSAGNTLRNLLTHVPPRGLDLVCEEVRPAPMTPAIPREYRGVRILSRAHVIVVARPGEGRWRYLRRSPLRRLRERLFGSRRRDA